MMKRMISIVLATMMLVSLFAVSASAANDATITVASANGKKGDIVEVLVTISENSYLVNADMHVTFDSTKVKLVAYYADPDGDDGDLICYSTENTVLGNGWMYLGNEITKGDFVFVAATGSQVGLTKGGELFRLAFEILVDEDVEVAVNFSANPVRANDGNGAIGADGYPVDYALDLTVVNGVVAVEKEEVILVGDVTGDGAINMMDVLMLYNSTSGKNQLTDEQRVRADMTGDGAINMMDVLRLYNRVSKGE